jgi:uncharacterized protein YlxW (UPF0749 family)
MKEINKKYAEINELKALLASTDYQVIKEAEGGYSVPQEIIDERQDARARINILKAEIEQMEAALEDASAEVERYIE